MLAWKLVGSGTPTERTDKKEEEWTVSNGNRLTNGLDIVLKREISE